MAQEDVLAFVLGGGAGNRLMPLTRDRAKPAVSFGGTFRLIDFVLSNFYNSDIRKVYVLTQYETSSLHNHIRSGWYPLFGFGPKGFLRTQPATLGSQSGWYQGTADAINRNKRFIIEHDPDLVNIFGGDHVYLMDVRQMNDFHAKNDADITISSIPVNIKLAANNYGVLEIDKKGRVFDFKEKPADPKPMPTNQDMCLTSMGNYTFKASSLMEMIELDEKKETGTREQVTLDPEKYSTHDFGIDIIPAMLKDKRRVFAYNFKENDIPGLKEIERGYWRDIGDRDQYYIANMEVRSINPPINLYNEKWPVLTYIPRAQGAKIIEGKVQDSILSHGCIVSYSSVNGSLISYDTHIERSSVSDSILLGDTFIESGCEIVKAVIDRHVRIPSGTKIGIDQAEDEARGFTVTESGITFVPRKFVFK